MNKKKNSLKLSKREIAIAGVIIILIIVSIAVFCCAKKELAAAIANFAAELLAIILILFFVSVPFRRRLSNIKHNADPFFKEIDEKISACKFDDKVKTIQYIYQDGSAIDKIVEETGLEILVKRKNCLEAKASINDAASFIVLPFIISYCASVYVTYTFPSFTESIAPYITFTFLIFTSIVLLFATLYYIAYREDEDAAVWAFEEIKVNEKLEKFKSCIPPIEDIDDIVKTYMEGQSKLTQTEDVKKCQRVCMKTKIKSFGEAVHKLHTKFKTRIKSLLESKKAQEEKGEIEK